MSVYIEDFLGVPLKRPERTVRVDVFAFNVQGHARFYAKQCYFGLPGRFVRTEPPSGRRYEFPCEPPTVFSSIVVAR